MQLRTKYSVAVFLWAAAIMILCGIPGNDLPELSFLDWLRPDKVTHFILFGVLCYLLLKAFHAHSISRFKLYAVVLSVLYGILTEVLQSTIFINRTGDYRDALADAIGALMGLWWFNRSMKRKLAEA